MSVNDLLAGMRYAMRHHSGDHLLDELQGQIERLRCEYRTNKKQFTEKDIAFLREVSTSIVMLEQLLNLQESIREIRDRSKFIQRNLEKIKQKLAATPDSDSNGIRQLVNDKISEIQSSLPGKYT